MPRLQIPATTLTDLDFATAAATEAEAPAGLLPPSIVDELLTLHAEEIADYLRAELTYGLPVVAPETISVSKPSRGRRPVAILTHKERVLYRALVDALGDAAPVPSRGAAAYDEFKRSPLDADSVQFVLMTDVASCYEYVDHQVLHHEMISRTGDPFVADAVVGLLQALEGRRFGIPQNRASSHRLAELVLAIPERMLTRQGYEVSRFSDDFRVATATRVQAHQAAEALQDALRIVGLTLNDEKTVIKSLPQYIEWADAFELKQRTVQRNAAIVLSDFSYEGDVIPPDQGGVMAESADRLLHLWYTDLDTFGKRYGLDGLVGRQFLSVALGALGALQDARALEYCSLILDYARSLTPHVARYMGTLLPTHEAHVNEHFDSVIAEEDRFLSGWQCLWLFQALGHPRSDGVTPTQREWLLNQVNTNQDYVAAAAATVLASFGVAPVADLVHSFDSMTMASRPLAVQAMCIQRESLSQAALQAVIAEDELYSWIFTRVEMDEMW